MHHSSIYRWDLGFPFHLFLFITFTVIRLGHFLLQSGSFSIVSRKGPVDSKPGYTGSLEHRLDPITVLPLLVLVSAHAVCLKFVCFVLVLALLLR